MADTSMSGIGLAALAAGVVAVYAISVYNDRNPTPAQVSHRAAAEHVAESLTKAPAKKAQKSEVTVTTRKPEGENPPDAKPVPGGGGAVRWQEKQEDGRVATVTRTPQSNPPTKPCSDTTKSWVLVTPGKVNPRTLVTEDAKWECQTPTT